MNRLFSFLRKNILFLETLFLLLFIPLYPKIPLLDVKNTWVYIRVEDFLVLFVLASWAFLLLRKKISLRTPLTLPLLIFWIVGAVATLHGILLIFPTLANVFPNVAFLSLVRHIEYMSLFFIAYQSINDKKQVPIILSTVVIALIGVIAYGLGQKYLGFPAYLTMNEEFAKGIPIQLSSLSRVPSTFAGHYDLAAYLVLIVPIIVSAFFAFKNIFLKGFFLITAFFGLILMFMTVSRVSLFALLIAIGVVIFFQKRKLIFVSVPLLIVCAIALLIYQPSLLNRFKSTISETDVLIDAKTGSAVGNVKFVPASYFENKIVLQKRVGSQDELVKAIAGDVTNNDSSLSTILPFKLIPQRVPLVTASNISTGEDLPQGTGYINLSLSPVVERLGNFFYEFPPSVHASPSAQAIVLHGDFIVKKADAYDLSFTTRFQGEWPRAIEAFERDIIFGSGYGSVSLAVDNNYFRMLAETGLLGFISFLVLFLAVGIYLRKIFPDIDSPVAKSFVLGFGAGVIGLFFNATLIDVFEASKIAFVLWMLVGVTLGILVLYQKKQFALIDELRKAASSTYAIALYLLSMCIVLYSSMLNNFFVGDDFTWFRWAADAPSNLLDYFTQANGFFYRPGTKLYFYAMYKTFWLNPVAYHAVSLVLHFAVTVLFYILAKKILKGTLLPAMAAFLFLIMSGYSEMVFWIASTGHLFNAMFGLLGLIAFIYWDEKKKPYLYVLSFISFALALLFHELGVVFPLLILAYKAKDLSISHLKNTLKRLDFLLLFVPVIAYLILRFLASSHWQGGDYSYDLLKLPFNFIGNIFGYTALTFMGPTSLSFYEIFRNVTKENMVLAIILVPLSLALLFLIFKQGAKILNREEKGVIAFGLSFFIVSLLPFLGLGNITSRYSYMAALGLVLILVLGIRKLYEYLLDNGKQIALASVAVVVIVFSIFHVISVQQEFFDWHGAGEKSENFLISLDSFYSNNWSNGPVQFRFVDVPTKVGTAWVFPVGLEDAVWFAFKNNDAKTYKDSNLNDAINAAGTSVSNYVFKFNDDGTLELQKRINGVGN